MLFDLATLLIILLASVGVVLVISVVNLFRNESWSYSVNDGNVRLIGHMKKDSDSGSAQFMVPDDPSEPAIGHVQYKDSAGQVLVRKGTSSTTGKGRYKKVGYVGPDGYIYRYGKNGVTSERVGYLAAPSAPNVPTLKGERTWKDLWRTSRLLAFIGDPEAYVAPSAPERKKGRKVSGKKGKSQSDAAAMPEEGGAGAGTPVNFSSERVPAGDSAHRNAALLEEIEAAIADVKSELEAEAAALAAKAASQADHESALPETPGTEGPTLEEQAAVPGAATASSANDSAAGPAVSGPATVESASEPVSAEPAATEPVAAEPAATVPVAAEPEATEATTAEPAATEPATAEPAATVPVAAEPEATEATTAEPAATELVAAEPAATVPVAAEPEATEATTAEPAATEPATAEPAATVPAAEPAATETATAEPAATEPVAAEPAATVPAAPEPAELKVPVLVGCGIKTGWLSGEIPGCPITLEARAAAFAAMYNQDGEAYSEHLASSAYSWKDTALFTSVVYALVFLVIYFVNVGILEYPLLGNDFKAILIFTAFFFVFWALVRACKIFSIESGRSWQPFFNLFNKSLGLKKVDLFILILSFIALPLSFFKFDMDFIPLFLALLLGTGINRMLGRNGRKWDVANPLAPDQDDADEEELYDKKTSLLNKPEGDVPVEYNWKLQPFDSAAELEFQVAFWYDREQVDSQRLMNPFYMENPRLRNRPSVFKAYVAKMVDMVKNRTDFNLHLRYVIQEMDRLAGKYGLTEADRLQQVLDFVQQAIAYVKDDESKTISKPYIYVRFPDETLFDREGDCNCKAFLAASMYYMMGLDVVYASSTTLGHTVIGVKLGQEILDACGIEAGNDNVLEYNNQRYILCETTHGGFRIGQTAEGDSAARFDVIVEYIHEHEE